MRSVFLTLVAALLLVPPTLAQPGARSSQATYIGFDRNEYPGDEALPALHQHFAFTGYWLTNPPGDHHNSWAGKRAMLREAGFGFLVVANGKLDQEILAAQKHGTSAGDLGKADAAIAVAAARREGFPSRTILFLDQEEGGRLLGEQAEYLLAWTEAVATSNYRAGVYASGQPVPDGRGPDGKPVTITTILDVRTRIARRHLHPVSFWIAQDACPPAPGCVLQPPGPSASGTPEIRLADGFSDIAAWQYAQSPRRPDITSACGRTYASDGNCYSPAPARFFIDLSSSTSPDPSHGR